MTKKDNDVLTTTLKQLNATLGKYTIIGNEDKENISTIYNQADFTILKNEYDLIYNDNKNPLLLIGLSSLITNQQDIDKGFDYFNQESYNSNIYTITLVHEPDSTDNIINNYHTDIIMAGHSHNGNIRLPIINYPLFKYNGAKKYNQNYYFIKNTKLFISGGLGTNNKSGIRIFCRPSINLYRLSNKWFFIIRRYPCYLLFLSLIYIFSSPIFLLFKLTTTLPAIFSFALSNICTIVETLLNSESKSG